MLRHPSHLRLVQLWLALTTSLSGCGDAFGPRDAAGAFVLLAPMPPVHSGDMIARVVADTFFLRADGTAAKHVWTEIVRTSTADTSRVADTSAYTYVIEASAIGFLWQCRIGQVCAAAARRDWFDFSLGASTMRSRAQPEVTYVRISTPAP